MAFGFGGSRSSSRSSSQVFQPWGQAASGLYGNAGAAAGAYAPQAQQLGNQIQQGGMGALGSLGMLAQIGNPFVMNQIQNLGQEFGSFYQNQLLPGINSDFQLAGTGGSSRQGIAQGLAGEGVARQFGSAATNLLGQSTGYAIDAANSYGGLGTDLQNIGLGGALGPWQILSNILGSAPIESQSRSRGGSAQFSFGGG